MLKEKEIKQFGKYRTRRLVLEAWDRLEGPEIGNPEGYRGASPEVEGTKEVMSVKEKLPESRQVITPVHVETSGMQCEEPSQT